MINETQLVQKVETFGDVRRLILETVMMLRDQQIDVGRGMAMAANMKVLNDNIQTEINAAKLSILTEGKAYEFGKVVKLGRRLVSDNADLDA